ncbi:MAG: DedA family protein [Gemmata sp.]
MLEHLSASGYHYLGIFTALMAASTFVPMPEELPVITAGIMVGHSDAEYDGEPHPDPNNTDPDRRDEVRRRDDPRRLRWWIMLPVVMAGVVIGDGLLYTVGRLWGRRLLDLKWVQRRLLPPDKRERIEKNFHDRGIMILLGARFLPGIRGPIFVMAGVLRVPAGRFMLADAIYAVPLVNILFWLSYFLTDQVLFIFNKINAYKPLVIVAILSGIAGAMIQKYILSRHVSTGEPPHVPDLIAKPAVAVGHAVEKAVEMAVDTVTGRHHDKAPEAPAGGAADREFGTPVEEPGADGPKA